MKKERNASFELLRILSMCMVIMLHALDKSGILASDNHNANFYISWILEALSIQAVNLYVLISGYFLVQARFKTGRLLELICQVLFYSLIGLGVGLSFNLFDPGYINNFTLFEFLFPIHADKYWFVTKYIIMYLFSPVLAIAVKKTSQKQLGAIILLLLIYESLIKSICPIVFIPDKKGYDALWFMILFLIAGYIRLYGLKFIDSKGKGLVAYFGGALLIVLETLLVALVNEKTGHFAEIKRVALDYNHVFVLISSIGLFVAFVKGKEIHGKAGTVICALSPMTLGVYLFHENPAIRFKWQQILGLSSAFEESVLKYLLILFLTVIGVYICGTAFDFVRKCIFDLVKKLCCKWKINLWLANMDGIINGEK